MPAPTRIIGLLTALIVPAGLVTPAAAAAPGGDPVDAVNTFIGTKDDGNTFPGTVGALRDDPRSARYSSRYAGSAQATPRSAGSGISSCPARVLREQGGLVSTPADDRRGRSRRGVRHGKPESSTAKLYASPCAHVSGEVGKPGYRGAAHRLRRRRRGDHRDHAGPASSGTRSRNRAMPTFSSTSGRRTTRTGRRPAICAWSGTGPSREWSVAGLLRRRAVRPGSTATFDGRTNSSAPGRRRADPGLEECRRRCGSAGCLADLRRRTGHRLNSHFPCGRSRRAGQPRRGEGPHPSTRSVRPRRNPGARNCPPWTSPVPRTTARCSTRPCTTRCCSR